MRNLNIWIEMDGENIRVGEIVGDDYSDACFAYDREYCSNPNHRPISLSLPFGLDKFSATQTRNFFEGLLPEGFTRRCICEQMRVDERDYLSVLAGLGKECLGAIKVTEEGDTDIVAEYRKLTKEDVANLAKEGAGESVQLVTKSHLSLTGASGKVGLYYDKSTKEWFQPIGDAPSTHIVKQSHIRLKKIVANEQLCLLTAKKLGIDVPESFIINTGVADDEDVLFATQRYDRVFHKGNKCIGGKQIPYRLHQEDFAQALGIASYEKYEKPNQNYLKRMFEILRNFSADPINDQLKLWNLCVFNYLIGNTDNHIKNISLLYSSDLKTLRLAPAYDIVSTVVYESSTEEMGMSINGIYNIHKITREDFEKEAKKIGLGKKPAMTAFDQMATAFVSALESARNELTKQGFYQANDIYEVIIQSGGIRHYL